MFSFISYFILCVSRGCSPMLLATAGSLAKGGRSLSLTRQVCCGVGAGPSLSLFVLSVTVRLVCPFLFWEREGVIF